MDALGRIIQQIRLEAENKVESLRADNEQQCARLVEKGNKQLEVERVRLAERIEVFKQNLRFNVDSDNLIFKKKEILATKQKIISFVKEKAVDALCSSKDYSERYFCFMERLIESNLPCESCVLFYGNQDYLRFLEKLKFKNGDSLKIEKSDEFNYGALICCVDFEINLNVEELISDWIFKFKSEILAILAQGELFSE